MSGVSKKMATGLALARSLRRMSLAGRLRSYPREMQGDYALTYMNLFLSLRELRQSRRIAHLARRNVWERFYNDLDFEALTWDQFETVNLEALPQALNAGRGALLATQHFGPYRRTFYELMRRGFTVNLVLDAVVSAQAYHQVRTQLSRQKKSLPDLEERLHIINAEQPGSARQILRALKRNEPVLIYLDGNTGVGGQSETIKHSVTVDFFGQRVAVRKGTCHLAYLARAPIIPLFASWRQGRRPMMEFCDAILPDPALKVEDFCQQGMQKLYTLSEAFITKQPEQFEEWKHLHRWRLTETGSAAATHAPSLKETYSQLERQMAEGRTRYRVDPSKAITVRVGGQDLLVDGERRKVLKARPLTREIVKGLADGRALKALMTRLQKNYQRQEVLEELARLKGLQLLDELTPAISSASPEKAFTASDKPSPAAPVKLASSAGRPPRRLRRLTKLIPPLVSNCLRFPEKRHYLETLRNTYYTDYINLSLAFRHTKSQREIRRLARQAVLNYLRNSAVRNVPEAWEGFELRGAEALEEALSSGRGAVVVSEHLGPQQFAFIELANRGYLINAAISQHALVRVQPWVDRLISELRSPQHVIDGKKIEQYLRIISVENPGSALRMVRALKRGEIVMFDLDGNLGVGGEERTREEPFTVTFLGREVHVRRGAAYLSYKTGAPIVPVVPSWGAGGRPQLTFHAPIQAAEDETLDDFCRRSLRQLYAILEARVEQAPADWEMWPEFYKWISPATKLNDADEARDLMQSCFRELQQRLAGPADFLLRVDPRAAFVVKIKRRHLLIDLPGFRFFLVNRSTREILKLLYQGVTLHTAIRQLSPRYSAPQILKELARLRMLHLLEEKA